MMEENYYFRSIILLLSYFCTEIHTPVFELLYSTDAPQIAVSLSSLCFVNYNVLFKLYLAYVSMNVRQ